MEFLKRRWFYMVATALLGCMVLCIGTMAREMAPQLWMLPASRTPTEETLPDEEMIDMTEETTDLAESAEDTEAVTEQVTQEVVTEPMETEPIETESEETEPPFVEDVSPSVTEEAETEPIIVWPKDPDVIPAYDASSAVKESPAVDDSYFQDAVFIGNSLMVGFSRATNLDTTYFATIGLNAQSFFTQQFIPGEGDELLTVSQALETVDFTKVYLLFGTNELTWPSPEGWAERYRLIIDRIYEVNPDAVIYAQSVFPICMEKYEQSPEYKPEITNMAAVHLNELLIEICKEKGAHFVNVAETVRAENGQMIPEATGDGLHLNYTYCGVWLDYLKTHTVQNAEK